MSDKKDTGMQSGVKRMKELIDRVLGWIENAVPKPRPAPVPVRVKDRER